MQHLRPFRLTTLLLVLLLLPLTTGCERLQRAMHGSDALSQVLVTVDGQPITERDLVIALQNQYGDEMMQKLMLQKKIAYQADKLHATLDEKRYQEAHQQLARSINNAHVLAAEDAFLRSRLLLDAVVLKSISDKDRHQFYDDFKEELQTFDVSHILVPDEHEAGQVEQQLKTGGDFALIAGQMSSDKRSAKEGGHLGRMTYGQLKRTFGLQAAEAIRKLKPNEISAPIRSPFGFHIVKLASVATTYDELKQTIDEQMAASQRVAVMQNMQKSLEGMKTAAPVAVPSYNVFAPLAKGSATPGPAGNSSPAASPTSTGATDVGAPAQSGSPDALGQPAGGSTSTFDFNQGSSSSPSSTP